MFRFLPLALIAAGATASYTAPALAQTAAEEQRFQTAQERYDRETQIFQREQDIYEAARRRGGGHRYDRGSGYQAPGYDEGYRPDPGYNPAYPPQGGYGAPEGSYAPPGGYADEGDGYTDRDEGYDPSRDYRPGNYQERVVSPDERVYAGNDGRYYCKRSDGTTGLIIGGAAGGLLGNVIQGGHSRVLGTLLGGAAGAFAGKSIDQNNSQVRCR